MYGRSASPSQGLDSGDRRNLLSSGWIATCLRLSRAKGIPNGVDAVREPWRAKESFRPETSATASGGRRLRRVLDQYARFFSTAATASAAFSGLLFVAVSVVNRDDSQ